ncbi:glycine betaine/L-proline ABC transporter, ATPase subunit [Beutenbergia cavernae DSM 12333]|uniref:Glycine betaine/L-proline ABC transporter, ATPase subunit n=1 Tax=Beutenbergia cavernae (strain ATCC BAA-8 / DSM 12333 / CCUG 43141 / JCM 11478 / NBRC 16432 / NCIMB 13614 / HKI 0122) TaxID=471853 RepID=C5C1L9_BEUC1|nr:glycine betaine/L-proline ABC transporter ATP-binding protein [Beutenbergia cavernae]ACQ79487.1 glycine betaine/L-proline ABC transporter, ATPase subunit [Beutenbergia cavernae DSM 12333]
MNAIRAEHVYKVFGRREHEAVRRLADGATREEVKPLGTAAVIDASFEVAAGEIFVVMGLSGSGKSTLIRMLNGLWRPSAGQILLGDDDLSNVNAARLREIRRRKVSMVFQHFALLPHRTVLDNAAYPLEIQGVERAARLERAAEALSMVGLDGWENSLPGALSGGMRQRVGLARALAADTEILLMDEAFSALDPLIRREMQEQLVELQARLGKTIVFITHDLNEAMFLGDRIAMMRDGRIVQVGTAEQILSDPATDYVAQFVADVDRTRVLTASSVMRPPTVVVPASGGPRQALRTMNDAQVSAAFVVDRQRVFRGVVQDDAVLAAQRAGAESIAQIVRPDERAVSPDAPLSEIFAPAAESVLPVPVVDDGGRLLGVVPRVTLLEAMAPAESPTNGEVPAADALVGASSDPTAPEEVPS